MASSGKKRLRQNLQSCMRALGSCTWFPYSRGDIHFINHGGFVGIWHMSSNLRALKTLMLYKNHIFQCMDKIFCVEFQRVPHNMLPIH